MLDVEKVKTILQAELKKREKAKEEWIKYRSSEHYEKRYRRYCSRFSGMCYMLYELGYLAWASDDNSEVFVEKRVVLVD